MNVEQVIKALHELKLKDKVSDQQKELLHHLLTSLLSAAEGVAALRAQLTPTITFNRKITQALIEEIQGRLERNETELRDPTLRLLGYIAHGDKIDSASLWMAISVYLKLGPPDAPRLLAEVLDTIPQKDLEDRYERYGYPFLNPDGGLPFLLALTLDGGNRSYPWLSGLVERIANRVWKSGQITDLSLKQVQTYLTRLSQMNPIRFMRADRPLLLLAMAHMEREEGLRELLENLLKSLPEPDPNDQAQRDWRPIIAQRIKERLENKPSPIPTYVPPPAPPPAPVVRPALTPHSAAPSTPVSSPRSETSPESILGPKEPRAFDSPFPPASLPPRGTPSSIFSSPSNPRSERPSIRPPAAELTGADFDLLIQQILQGAEKLRAWGKENAQLRDTVKNLEGQLAAAREAVESLDSAVKERDQKLARAMAKLSATQQQYEFALRRLGQLQKRYEPLEGPQEPELAGEVTTDEG